MVLHRGAGPNRESITTTLTNSPLKVPPKNPLSLPAKGLYLYVIAVKFGFYSHFVRPVIVIPLAVSALFYLVCLHLFIVTDGLRSLVN